MGWLPDASSFLTKSSVDGATIATTETTTSSTFTDLATAGPAVTAITGARALVYLGAAFDNNDAAGTSLMGFDVSGASSVAASVVDSVSSQGTNGLRAGGWFLVTGLTPGSNVFTAKYRTATGTAEFSGRRIIVVPL